MTLRNILLLLTLFFLGGSPGYASDDFKESKEYLELREAMHHAFNDGDSARFFPALKKLENYLLAQGDQHAYYNQRCNEIIFLMNQQQIFEAYKLASQLSKELREKKVDKEMYMAMNMLGHINRYCGNKEEAKENWREVLRMMEKQGYYSNMPPIYMNIVNVALNDDPAEADSLLDKALEIAKKYAQERVFDIETRHSLSFYNRGEFDKFVEGYKAYKEGEKEGKSSVHGRSMEIYYQAYLGNVDKAVELAKKELGDEGSDAIPIIYEKAGRWQEAYEALKQEYAKSDSIDNVVLTNSMQGIREEIRLYDSERKAYRARLIGLTAAILLLSLLIVALVYIVQTRRRHLKEMQAAYEHAKESDKMKTAFIQNISHEIRTPLNIISGFSQVIANPDLTESVEERQHLAGMMQDNAAQVTRLLDEIIGLSLIESTAKMNRNDEPKVNSMIRDTMKDFENIIAQGTSLRYETTLSEDFTFKTNESMLKRIINALLDNAAKYTEKGTITIRTTKEEDALLRITVEDTGCGIPANEADHIFERFVKLNTFKEGIGLGLPLSRRLAEQLGGTLQLDTTYTPGACFVIKLPIL